MGNAVSISNGQQWIKRLGGLYFLGTLLLAGCETTAPPATVEAIRHNDLSTLKAQLDSGVSPRTSYKYRSLMEYALLYKQWGMVDLLMQRGVSIYDANAIGSIFTTENFTWDEVTVVALMARGLDLKKPLQEGDMSPLGTTCGRPELAGLLLKHGAQPNQPMVIHNAVIYPTTLFACMSALRSINANYNEMPTATKASMRSYYEGKRAPIYQSLGLFVDAGADLLARTTAFSEPGKTPSCCSNVPIGETVLSLVVKEKDKQALDILQRHVQTQSSRKSPPGGAVTLASWLNQQDGNGNTALHFAAANGDEEMIKMLVAAGTNTSLKNRAGNTAQMEFEAKLASDEAARRQQLANDAAAERKRQQDAVDRDNTVRGLVAMAGMTAANYQANKNMQASQSIQAANFYADSKRAAEEQKADVARRNDLFRQSAAASSAARNSLAQAPVNTATPARSSSQPTPSIATSKKQNVVGSEETMAAANGTAAKSNWIEPTNEKMLWSDADAYCKSRSGRLPSLNEIRDFYLSGMTNRWSNKGDTWTSDRLGVDSQHYAYDTHGNGFGIGYERAPGFADSRFHAACIR